MRKVFYILRCAPLALFMAIPLFLMFVLYGLSHLAYRLFWRIETLGDRLQELIQGGARRYWRIMPPKDPADDEAAGA